MVDWDKELKEAKLRLLKRIYLEAFKKLEEWYEEVSKKK
jgi:hypothetical protein